MNNISLHGLAAKKRLSCMLSCILLLALLTSPNVLRAASQGALPGVFSVSKDKKVSFSQGNLQYNAGTNTWRFAEHQWNYVGNGNQQAAENYNGWIDLFSWGTSGWNGGVIAYQPWNHKGNYCKDYVLGSAEENYPMTDAYAKADWGVYNPISNGGNQAGLWRTLTRAEWEYIIDYRTNCENLSCVATVNGVKGLVILPDNWQTPEGLEWTPTGESHSLIWTYNIYDGDNWDKMEQVGALFLPSAGFMYFAELDKVGASGGYWTASVADECNAHALTFVDEIFIFNYYRSTAYSVRLAQDVESTTTDLFPKNLYAEQQGSVVYFSWDAVAGVPFYNFAIAQGENLIYASVTETNSIGVDFSTVPAGYYEFIWGVQSLDADKNVLSDWAMAPFAITLATGLNPNDADDSLNASPRKKLINGTMLILMPDGRKYGLTGEQR